MRFATIIAGYFMAIAMPLTSALAYTAPLPTSRPLHTAMPSAAIRGGVKPAVRNRDSVAVIIGNRNYQNGLPEVIYADNDAASMKRFVIDAMGYREGNVIDLRDATQAQMNSVFGNAREYRGKLWSWIREGRSDVLVYYSGHGMPGLRDKRGYLVPVDADPATPEINGYSLDLLLANLSKLDTRSTTVLLEACFSGNSAGGWLISSASPVYVQAAPPRRVAGMTVITAAQGDQVASWDHNAKLGLFTRHLLAGLYGAADKGPGGNGDGSVTVGELESHLNDEMSYAARRMFQRVQKASVSGNRRRMLASVPMHNVLSVSQRSTTRSQTPPKPIADTADLKLSAVTMNQTKRTVVQPKTAQTRNPSPIGVFHRPGRDRATVQAFVERYRDDLAETLRIHYSTTPGYVGRLPLTVLDMRVVATREHGFYLYVRYADQGASKTTPSYLLFRLRITSNQLVVEKMWQ